MHEAVVKGEPRAAVVAVGIRDARARGPLRPDDDRGEERAHRQQLDDSPCTPHVLLNHPPWRKLRAAASRASPWILLPHFSLCLYKLNVIWAGGPPHPSSPARSSSGRSRCS